MRLPYFTRKLSSTLDSLAIGLSGLCLVHCLALPVLIALFPILGFGLVDHESFHQIILVAVIPTTTLALGAGYRRHRRKAIALLGTIGVAALTYAAFALHAQHAHAMETWVTVAGGLILSIAHIANYRHCSHARHAAQCVAGSEQG